MEIENRTFLGDCVETLKNFPDACVDMVVTSPPYDDLRTYGGVATFDRDGLFQNLLRVMKDGGVMCWVANDTQRDCDRTLTVFKDALRMKDFGWRCLDVMIWDKNYSFCSKQQHYLYVFEYILVMLKGKTPKTFNPICDRKNLTFGTQAQRVERRNKNGDFIWNNRPPIAEFGKRHNIWRISPCENSKENFADHPAKFPVRLVKDLISSWSDEGDLVLDPFLGSGTTCATARSMGRRWCGIEIYEKYKDAADRRIALHENLFEEK